MFTQDIKDCFDTLDVLYQTKEFIACDRLSGLSIAVITVELVPCWSVMSNGKENRDTRFEITIWCTYENNKSSLTCVCQV